MENNRMAIDLENKNNGMVGEGSMPADLVSAADEAAEQASTVTEPSAAPAAADDASTASEPTTPTTTGPVASTAASTGDAGTTFQPGSLADSVRTESMGEAPASEPQPADQATTVLPTADTASAPQSAPTTMLPQAAAEPAIRQGPAAGQTIPHPVTPVPAILPAGGPEGNGVSPSAVRVGKAPAWVAPTASAAIAVLLSLGLGYGLLASGTVTIPSTASMASIGSTATGGKTSGKIDADAWSKVASSVKGSVVAISAVNGQSVAKGSGAILDTDGDIVTNEHVVDGDGEISVTLSNGQIYKAKRVGADATTDLAVIRLVDGPKDLKPVKFADSSKLTVGQGVLAVGNPLGYSDTATTGIVSAVNRPVSVSSEETSNGLVVTNAVQIDAAINPGNSGGPTFDSDGKVIGVNSSIASTGSSTGDNSGSIGIGFAIPSNLVQRVTSDLIRNGSVKHVQLGVMIADSAVTADGVTRVGAKITPSKTDKAVVEGGSADEAGLKENDVIVGWDGESVDGATSLMGYVRAAEYGSKHTVTFVRDGEAKNVVVTLDHEEKTTASKSEDKADSSSSGSDGGFDPYGFFDGLGW